MRNQLNCLNVTKKEEELLYLAEHPPGDLISFRPQEVEINRKGGGAYPRTFFFEQNLIV